MKRLNCTTPFGLKRSSICKTAEKARNASEIAHNLSMEALKFTWPECQIPCKILLVKIKELFKKNLKGLNDTLVLNFKMLIKVTEAYKSYQELELLAEFGGYVGLFLGFSIFDLGSFVKKIAELLSITRPNFQE